MTFDAQVELNKQVTAKKSATSGAASGLRAVASVTAAF